MIKIGIIGGAGYTAGELIRILLNHPNAKIVFVHSKSNAENKISSIHQDLIGETGLKFTNHLNHNVDVIFLCLGHGESKNFLLKNNLPNTVKVIDLANDFRLHQQSVIGNHKFIYGLPELQKEKIKTANNIANPGCFATAIQLGLLPLAKAGLLIETYTTGITGSTGAGQGLAATSHFSWRANNIQAYKTLSHQHVPEIMESLNALKPINQLSISPINFIPWRGDFTKGIFVSSQLKCNLSLEELNILYKDFYTPHPFVSVTTDAVFLKQVVNTNKCIIQLEKVNDNVVIHTVIDNLIKGASGQAIQNMNLIFGLDETIGLKLKANYF